MLETIGISIILLMLFGACAAGAIGMGIEMVKLFKEKDWSEALHALAIHLLLALVGGLVLFAWICYLGGSPC